MDTEQLEVLLRLGHETQTFEVKGPMLWDVKKLVKDFLAMSNHRDGGSIVIGVQDGTFERHGVDDATRVTYKIDIMRDQLKRYADPPMRFSVATVSDFDGRQYMVISIASFDRVPVICQCDNGLGDEKDKSTGRARTRTERADAVYAGQIYYRNSDKKVESAPISNAADMMELVLIAAGRSDGWVQSFGYNRPEDNLTKELDDELGGL